MTCVQVLVAGFFPASGTPQRGHGLARTCLLSPATFLAAAIPPAIPPTIAGITHVSIALPNAYFLKSGCAGSLCESILKRVVYSLTAPPLSAQAPQRR